MCVYYLDEKLNAIYQQGSYIPEILQNSGKKYRTEKKCEKAKLFFVVLDASHARLFYQPRVFLMWFEPEDDSN